MVDQLTIPRRVADFILRQADKPSGWWPFPSLRPQPRDRMTTLFVLKMALVYGLVAGVIFWLLIGAFSIALMALSGAGIQPLSLLVALPFSLFLMVAISLLIIAPLYRLSMAVLWNRRARRLGEMPLQPPPSPLSHEHPAVAVDRPEDAP